MINVADNFSYLGQKPLDGRIKYDTLAAMKAMADSTLYDGCLAYCVATDKTYQWKSTNTVDADTGKWREFTSGGGTGGGHTIEDPEGTALTQRDTLQFGGDLEVSDDDENEKTVVAPHELTAAELTEIMSTLPSVPVRWKEGDGISISNDTISTDSSVYRSADTAETTIADNDYFPFYDTSATAKRKTLWSNIKAKLSEIYQAKLTAGTGISISDNTISVNGVLGGINYSVAEQDTGLKWIDGKKIYQKTINFGNLPNKTTKNIAHGISNLKRVIHISATWIQSETYSGSLETMGGDGDNGVDIYVNATNLSIITSTDRSNRFAYITVQYTKTT